MNDIFWFVFGVGVLIATLGAPALMVLLLLIGGNP